MTCQFEFSPEFDKLEEFLKFYQEKVTLQEPTEIHMNLPSEFWTAGGGYPNIEKNCWQTLRFAVEQMNRAHEVGQTLVSIRVQKLLGKA